MTITFGSRRKRKDSIKQLLETHMGGDCRNAHIISHVMKPVERVNLQLALDRLSGSDQSARLVGYSSHEYYDQSGLAHLLVSDNLFLAPVEREQLARDLNEHLDCVAKGLYLLRDNDEPLAIMMRKIEHGFSQHSLEVMAHHRETAHAVLSRLLKEAYSRNVYKGKTISLDMEQHWQKEITIRFHELPDATRDSIILPENVMQVIERNVFGLLKHGDILRRAGRNTRHGLLFHGPPGTGKTLTIRYLANVCQEHTVILLSGRQLGLIKESCQIAKLLAPSIVVLEDVDLVAEERSRNECPVGLHELMDEMDGVGTKADVIFLLTTNRPDSIEPALSARPGRIDQAVYFPLPDETCRRRLFILYGQGLELKALSLARWIQQTDGVSPAFIAELLRKAALMAAERGETSTPLPLNDGDVEQAIHELVYFGGELTQKLLGYKTAEIPTTTS